MRNFLFLLLAGCCFLVACSKTETKGGKYTAVLVECIGNAAAQEINAVLMITNTGFNESHRVGGAVHGTMAIDDRGNTLKPHSNSGYLYEFPTGVPVRVTVERMGPVMQGTLTLRILTVSIGPSNNIVEFRNVPIVW